MSSGISTTDLLGELSSLLEKFVIRVHQERPVNIYEFAAEYFNHLYEGQDTHRSLPDIFSIRRKHERLKKSKLPSIFEPDEVNLTRKPQSALHRRNCVSGESFSPDIPYFTNTVFHAKTGQQRLKLNQVIRHILLFKSLDEEDFSEVLDAIEELHVRAGDVIINQNDDECEYFYVIESGEYESFITPPATSPEDNPQPKKVAKYVNEGSFGELALMYNTPRLATIIAKTDGVLWRLDRATFKRIVLYKAYAKRQAYEQFIESLPLLKNLTPYDRMSVADALQSRLFEDGENIFYEGDEGGEMYFVQEGAVRIVKLRKDGDEELALMEKGKYFGELALIRRQPRAASAFSVGKTKLAILDTEAFERILGKYVDSMQTCG